MPIGSILGGVIASGGANTASGILGQGIAGDQNQQRANQTTLGPYQISGINAQSKLDQLYGFGALLPDQAGGPGGWNVTGDPTGSYQKNALADFQTTPGYQFRLQQGINALDNSAASRGMVLSGAQARGISDYGQNTASQEYGNYINELNGMAGNGLNASNSLAGVNSGLQQNISGLYSGQAQYAQNAANYMASGINNAFQNTLAMAGAYGPMAGAQSNPFGSGAVNTGGGGGSSPLGGFSSMFGSNALAGGSGGASSGAVSGAGAGAVGAAGAGSSTVSGLGTYGPLLAWV